jgi:transposase
MKDAALTLKRHKDKILAYFYHRITNAICEGINSMIQAAKRKARGFNTFKGYTSMIYLIAGKLELAVPRPF